jgi:hypothetical protein
MREEVMALIRDLAAMLEPGARAVWATMVRQQVTSGALDMLLAVLAGVAAYFVGRASIRALNTDDRDDGDGTYMFGLCLAVGLAIASVLITHNALPHLLNPDYYAMMTLRGMLCPSNR